jgi:hypothetical protein
MSLYGYDPTRKFNDGSAGSPGIGFGLDGNLGIYRESEDVLAFAVTGGKVMSLDNTKMKSERAIYIPSGSAAAPSLTFGDDVNTGLFRSAADTLAFSVTGTQVMSVDNTKLKSERAVYIPSGSAAAPSLTFGDATNLGLYRSGTNTITLATNGVGRVSVNTANLISDLPIITTAGTAGGPSVTFNSDVDTGLYQYGSDQIGVACGGNSVGRFFNAGFVMNGNIFTNLTTSAGSLHWYLRTSTGVLRNAIGMGGTEAGSDAGSNLSFWNYTDAGGFKAQIYENERSTNNNSFWGRLWAGASASLTIPSIGFLNQTDCGFSSYYTDQIDIITNSVRRFSITNNSILPSADASYNLGAAGLRMNTIYASVGTINTSDQTLKEDITECPLGLEFVKQLQPKKYKWKTQSYEEKYREDGTGAEEKTRIIEKTHSRYHLGLIAQDVKTVLDDLKISTNDFAGYVDSSVNEPEEPQVLGLNYIQFIAPLIKAVQELSALNTSLTATVTDLTATVTDLTATVTDLTARIEALEGAP